MRFDVNGRSRVINRQNVSFFFSLSFSTLGTKLFKTSTRLMLSNCWLIDFVIVRLCFREGGAGKGGHGRNI